jgi:hypothetical protein
VLPFGIPGTAGDVVVDEGLGAPAMALRFNGDGTVLVYSGPQTNSYYANKVNISGGNPLGPYVPVEGQPGYGYFPTIT